MNKEELQYHIKVANVHKHCLIAGNPDRVPKIAQHLKDPTKKAEHRGLVTYEGLTPEKEIPVSVVTTGMGGPSTSIVLEEMKRAGAETIIRIGSTGALQPIKQHDIGTLFIPHGAVRDEGTSEYYAPYKVPAVATPRVYLALLAAAKDVSENYANGLVLTSDIYYNEDFHKWLRYNVTCIEMEVSILFTFGLVNGLSTGAILTADGNHALDTNIYRGNIETNIKKFQAGVDDSIEIAIHAVEHLE